MTNSTETQSEGVRRFASPRVWNAVQSASAVVAIASAYIYFLIFAQFAYVKLLQNDGLNHGGLRIVMACMGFAGIVASLRAGRAFRAEVGAQRLGLVIGFIGCGIAALLALYAQGLVLHGLVAAMIGGGLGTLTVNLAAGLPLFFAHGFAARNRGLCVGLGTGLAYAVCNIPAVFAGTPLRQTLLAAAACAVGTIAANFLKTAPAPDKSRSLEVSGPPSRAGAELAFGALVAIFLALVWLDSAAFYILQATPELNQYGWGSAGLQWKNAGVHLCMAILSGVFLDRGCLYRVLAAAFATLACAALCISTHTPAALMTHWLYAAGVSLYSTALVFAPTAVISQGERCSAKRRSGASQAAMRAGILYAIAGWAGSALGIGMAQDLHEIPLWFVGLAGAVVLCCSISTARFFWPDFLWRMAFVAGIEILAFLVANTSSSHRISIGRGVTDVAVGREVYISEGCLNCHTQFVRKGTADELWWGPVTNPQNILKQAPPLIGNRRQGPDLLNVGNRRSTAWNRVHLIKPRALSPDSRMPSYAYLFASGDSRGDALVAYLASLGAETFESRTATCRNWHPAPGTKPMGRSEQAKLFRRACAQCHGLDGRGEGPLASEVSQPAPPRDLTLGQWRFFARNSYLPSIDLARTIKFGVAGTSMPGHEMLSDAEVLGLAKYVHFLTLPEKQLMQPHEDSGMHALLNGRSGTEEDGF